MVSFLWVCTSIILPTLLAAEFVINVADYLPEDFKEAAQFLPQQFSNLTERKINNSDVGLDIKGFLKKYGYPLETHTVTTEDGYILTMHRIPSGKNEENKVRETTTKPAVLMMHGILCSSVDFVNRGPEKSLGLLLADQGYDVWLGNNRGNKWSKKHTSLDPKKNKTFWDFSFHENGYYDLAAKIDYILNQTKLEKISYVGHSQGTTQYYVLTSTRPEYNDKITVMSALAPVGFMEHIPNPIIQILKGDLIPLMTWLAANNYTGLFSNSLINLALSRVICTDEKLVSVCSLVYSGLSGFDNDQLDMTFLQVFYSNAPSGASLRQLTHYAQEIVSGKFRQYDHGILKNQEIYNQSFPPEYNLTLITSPVALFYAQNDWMTSTKDVELLASKLPNVIENHIVENKKFSHLDFMYAKDVNYYVNYYVINLLNKYNGIQELTTSTTESTSISSTESTSSSSSGTTQSNPTTTTDSTPTTKHGNKANSIFPGYYLGLCFVLVFKSLLS